MDLEHAIQIAAGAPRTDLLGTQRLRVLVRSAIARKMFGTSEILVAAMQLLQSDGIEIAEDIDGTEYFHMHLRKSMMPDRWQDGRSGAKDCTIFVDHPAGAAAASWHPMDAVAAANYVSIHAERSNAA